MPESFKPLYKAKGIRLEAYDDPRLRIFELRTSPDLAIITGTSNILLARKVARILAEDFGIAAGRFADREVSVQIPTTLDNRDVFIIQPTNPIGDNMLELIQMIRACKLADARRITAVVPYFGYARDDRKDARGTPISARLMADIITAAGATRIVTVDIHSQQELGFADCPWNNLYASRVQIPAILALKLSHPCFVSVDDGGEKRTKAYARRAGFDENKDTATVVKKRDGANSNALFLKGEVSGREVVFIDDIVNSAISLTSAVRLVKQMGATDIFALITHGMMFKKGHRIHEAQIDGRTVQVVKDTRVDHEALKRIEDSGITTLFLTDTVRQPWEVVRHPRIKIISVAPLLAEAITRLHVGTPLSPELVD